ncbi:MAG: hypothetical protein U1F43_16180 [Myxococcota bacterium]
MLAAPNAWTDMIGPSPMLPGPLRAVRFGMSRAEIAALVPLERDDAVRFGTVYDVVKGMAGLFLEFDEHGALDAIAWYIVAEAGESEAAFKARVAGELTRRWGAAQPSGHFGGSYRWFEPPATPGGFGLFVAAEARMAGTIIVSFCPYRPLESLLGPPGQPSVGAPFGLVDAGPKELEALGDPNLRAAPDGVHMSWSVRTERGVLSLGAMLNEGRVVEVDIDLDPDSCDAFRAAFTRKWGRGKPGIEEEVHVLRWIDGGRSYVLEFDRLEELCRLGMEHRF